MKNYEDKAQHPNRRVSAQVEQPSEIGRPYLNWESGKRFPIKDTGWMNRNAKHIENITYLPGDGQSGKLQVSGHHPERGEFSHVVPFSDREQMRTDLQRPKWSHISVDDQMRDGGGPRHRPEMDAFQFGTGESGDCGRCQH